MKRTLFANLVLMGLALAIGTVGCKKPQKGVTPIPAAKTGTAPRGTGPTSANLGGGNTLGGGGDTTGTTGSTIKPTESGFDQGDLDLIEGMKPDKEFFKAQTVYFDFDSAVIKSSEHSKVDYVAEELKRQPQAKLMVEGNCDDRGTEEYNRALGERRALAAREYLIRLGIAPERVFTKSYGEDNPVNPAQNEDAWKENRRDDFVLLLPK